LDFIVSILKKPLVSILFPCYNAEPFLKYSLESIINQDYENLEIICVNDGSSDRTLDILNKYKKSDDRIIIINNEKNLGLIESLNKALPYVRGEYFARMDADDYSMENRISTQLEFLLRNPEIDLVSTGYQYFYNIDKKGNYVAPIAESFQALKLLSIFSTPLAHATILGRSTIIKNKQYYYDSHFPHAEDFELFSRLAWKNVKLGTINKNLYLVKLHSESVSVKFNSVQHQSNIDIVKRNLNVFYNNNTQTDNIICGLLACRINSIVSLKQLKEAFSIIDNCGSIYKTTIVIENLKEIENYLATHKLNILIQSNKFRFQKLGYKNIPFLLKTLTLLEINQIAYLLKKITSKF